MPANGYDPTLRVDLGAAALQRISDLGSSYADFRFERLRNQTLTARDRDLQTLVSSERVGYCVRVIHDGSWGFAYGFDLTADAAAATAARAVEVAKAFAPLAPEPVELADEPAHQSDFRSAYEIDPFTVPDDEKIAFLLGGHERAFGSGLIDHMDSHLMLVGEEKYFASLAGARIAQERIRCQSQFTGTKVDKSTGAFETMRTVGQGVGRGWEWFTGKGYDFDGELDVLGERLDEKLKAPSVEGGPTDLVIDPSNLWLTIHESIGHSTELDRALGYEANYAGTSFATLDKLNELHVGSPVMHVTGDRQVEHGLSTVGFDDEGVAAQTWDIIKDGVLVGYQLNRQMAAKLGFGRSNGCAFADAPGHVPLQRMPNVSLQPGSDPTTLDDLIGGVEDGLYVVGDKSWSIDMQRYNFQFTGQRFYKIKSGKLAGQVKDAAYQSNTIEFWNSMEAVGGPDSYVLGGALNCGKGQPGQVAPVSHGCPPVLFRGVNILNATAEGAA